MINLNEVLETNKMIAQENLDVRTITLGISLLDCIDTDLETVKQNIYKKITTTAKDLVATGQEIEAQIVDFNEEEKKISLSLKTLLNANEEAEEDYAEETEE